jgi:excisionase family DNA binding protein
VEAYITPKAAAERLAVSVKVVYKLAAGGELEVLRVGRSVRILASSLQDFIARNTVPRAEAAPEPSPTPSPYPRPTSRRQRPRSSGFVFLPPSP